MAQICKHGVRLPNHFHDCDYVDFRASLVPEAEAHADAAAGPRPPCVFGIKAGEDARNAQYDAWATAWNLLFHAYIDRAVKAHYAEKAESAA